MSSKSAYAQLFCRMHWVNIWIRHWEGGKLPQCWVALSASNLLSACDLTQHFSVHLPSVTRAWNTSQQPTHVIQSNLYKELSLIPLKGFWYVFPLPFSRTLAPKMMIALAEYLGMETFMASFRGRKKAEEAQTEAEKRCLVAEASDVLMK